MEAGDFSAQAQKDALELAISEVRQEMHTRNEELREEHRRMTTEMQEEQYERFARFYSVARRPLSVTSVGRFGVTPCYTGPLGSPVRQTLADLSVPSSTVHKRN